MSLDSSGDENLFHQSRDVANHNIFLLYSDMTSKSIRYIHIMPMIKRCILLIDHLIFKKHWAPRKQ